MSGALLEMLERYPRSLGDHWLLAVCCSLLALAFVTPKLRRQGQRLPRSTPVVLLAAAVLAGVAWGWELRWLCDDAFISFRYADNLARGQGFVFNPGERVEGYTNFLWTLILAGAIRLGLDPGQCSVVLGLLCFGLLIFLVARVARRITASAGMLWVSLASVLTAANYTLASFATSGLETMFSAMLVVLALERAVHGAPLAAGMAGIAATLSHPDHSIFYAALGISLLLDREGRRGWVRYAAPFGLVYLPYFLWRWSYYGDFFPNSYYAKSADLYYFEQGWKYLASFAIGSGFWLASPLVAYGAYVLRGSVLGRAVIIGVPLFALYVAKVGGDFMYGRLLCPVIAPMLLLAEAGARELLVSRRTGVAAVALVLLSAAAWPTRIIQPFEKKWHIADERSYYQLTSFSPIEIRSPYFYRAQQLRKQFVDRGLEPRLAVIGPGIIGYYTRLPLTDRYGITDRTVAHRPLTHRGRPGHEKMSSPAYLLSRDVDLSDLPIYPRPYLRFSRLRMGPFDYFLVGYDPRILGPLRGRRGVAFTDFERFLDAYVSQPPPEGQPGDLACDAWFMDVFYFSRVPGSRHREIIQRRLLERGRPLGEGVDGPPLPQDFQRTHHREALPVVLRKTATGGFRSAPIALVGDVMEIEVAGARDPAKLEVSLRIDGTRRFSATGCDTGIPGRRLWHIAAFKGKHAVLEVVDRSRGSWGWSVGEQIVQWVRALPEPAGAG